MNLTMVVTHESEASDHVLFKDTGKFRFHNLPVEIRLFIYRELLASRSDHRYLLCSCDSCQQNTNIDKDQGLRGEVTSLFPAILRTCKLVYDEAISILYRKNFLEIACVQKQMDISDTNLASEPTWFGASDFQVLQHNTLASTNMRQAFVSLEYCNNLEGFLKFWSLIEPTILGVYNKLERINIRLLRKRAPLCMILTLGRKKILPTKKCTYRLMDMANAATCDRNEIDLPSCYSLLQVIKLILEFGPVIEYQPSSGKGNMFHLQVIQWSDQAQLRGSETNKVMRIDE